MELATFIEEHDKLGAELVNHFCGDLDTAQTAIDDHYHGSFKSVADFAEELTEETTTIPDSLRFYIDYEAMARDLEINDVFTIETGFEDVHIFWNQ